MPASTKYRTCELHAQRDGLSIYGQLYLPGDYSGGKLPCVVCAHGFGANFLHNVPYAWYLAERGYAVCCFDFCGGGYASKSDGNPLDMSLATELADYEAVVQVLQARPEVDAANLYLMGEGQGGFVATMVAHEHQGWAKGLILLYPAFQLHDEARRTFPTKKNIPVSYRLYGMRVGRGYGNAVWDTNPYTQMRDYPGNVLIIHGDEDATSLIEYSERAADVFPSARLETIHGAKHVFRERYLTRAAQLMYEFVQAEVAGEPFVPSSEDDGAAEPAAKSATEPQAEVASKPTTQPAKAPAHAKPTPLVTADADADAVIAALSAAGATDVEVGEPDKHPVQKPKPAHAAAPEVQTKTSDHPSRTTHANTQRSRYNPNYVAKIASARHFRRQG